MRGLIRLFCAVSFLVPTVPTAFAQICDRAAPGSEAVEPTSLRSANGSLIVEFAFRSAVDSVGSKLYCYVYQDKVQSPTLRVQPGDELVLTLKNELPTAPGGPIMAHVHPLCGGGEVSAASTNLHFHGWSIPPTCHQDDTLRTLIQPSSPGFEYRIKIPSNQSPGLYWYHPHPHGYTEQQVLGGASGALIVEGIERVNPQVAGLPERVLILRDQTEHESNDPDDVDFLGKDISLNFVPVIFSFFRPALLTVRPTQQEFWRVLNASAGTYFDLQVLSGPGATDVRSPQTLRLVAVDGVAIGSADDRTSILLPPGARAEFIITTPRLGTFTQLVTRDYKTGPGGEPMPYRAIANIIPGDGAPPARSVMPNYSKPLPRFAGLSDLKPARQRKLYFSEDRPDLKDRNKKAQYFITLDGKTPRAFDMNFKKPDITALQGTVEDWTIENRAQEAHAFHIHQLHFQVLERDGNKVNEAMLRDIIDLPFWDGKSPQYPSVKLRMDFRAVEILGTFVFHCHILEHEDAGMMGSIQVVSPSRLPSR